MLRKRSCLFVCFFALFGCSSLMALGSPISTDSQDYKTFKTEFEKVRHLVSADAAGFLSQLEDKGNVTLEDLDKFSDLYECKIPSFPDPISDEDELQLKQFEFHMRLLAEKIQPQPQPHQRRPVSSPAELILSALDEPSGSCQTQSARSADHEDRLPRKVLMRGPSSAREHKDVIRLNQ